VLALHVHNYGSCYTQEVQFDVFMSLWEQLEAFVNLERSSWRFLWASSKRCLPSNEGQREGFNMGRWPGALVSCLEPQVGCSGMFP